MLSLSHLGLKQGVHDVAHIVHARQGVPPVRLVDGVAGKGGREGGGRRGGRRAAGGGGAGVGGRGGGAGLEEGEGTRAVSDPGSGWR